MRLLRTIQIIGSVEVRLLLLNEPLFFDMLMIVFRQSCIFVCVDFKSALHLRVLQARSVAAVQALSRLSRIEGYIEFVEEVNERRPLPSREVSLEGIVWRGR